VQETARDLIVRSPESGQPPCEVTRVLSATGRTPAQIARTLQISLGWTTSREQIDRAVELLAEACESAGF